MVWAEGRLGSRVALCSFRPEPTARTMQHIVCQEKHDDALFLSVKCHQMQFPCFHTCDAFHLKLDGNHEF